MSARKLLKELGITAQREVENTVREALSKGSLTGKETAGQDHLDLVRPACIWLSMARSSSNSSIGVALYPAQQSICSMPVNPLRC
jgi:Family of unknown function (DUF6494)